MLLCCHHETSQSKETLAPKFQLHPRILLLQTQCLPEDSIINDGIQLNLTFMFYLLPSSKCSIHSSRELSQHQRLSTLQLLHLLRGDQDGGSCKTQGSSWSSHFPSTSYQGLHPLCCSLCSSWSWQQSCKARWSPDSFHRCGFLGCRLDSLQNILGTLRMKHQTYIQVYNSHCHRNGNPSPPQYQACRCQCCSRYTQHQGNRTEH